MTDYVFESRMTHTVTHTPTKTGPENVFRQNNNQKAHTSSVGAQYYR